MYLVKDLKVSLMFCLIRCNRCFCFYTYFFSNALSSTGTNSNLYPSIPPDLATVNGNRRARVLYDYDAADNKEISLLADEVGS